MSRHAYADQILDMDTSRGIRRVIVSGETLNALRGKPAVASDIPALMNRHIDMFVRIAQAKTLACDRAVIRIYARDL